MVGKARLLLVFLISALVFSSSCTKKQNEKEVWIYTSLYKNVIAELEEKLKAKFPDVSFKWFQSGSENVAARLNAEISAGKPQADLIMTSDPFWYTELKKAGHLLPYASPAAASVDANFKDPENFFVTVRMCVAVMAHNPEAVPTPPDSWVGLTDPKWKGKISMGSPMESGTAMLVAAQLSQKNTWAYFEKLRKNDLLSAGGNSAVVSRLETRERPLGILLLENVLEAQKKGSAVKPIYPKEGVALVPSPIAILKTTKNPELTKAVYDYFFGPEMQRAILHGRMYSPVLLDESPEGALAYKELLKNTLPWNPALLEDLYQHREAMKKKFLETVLN